MPKGNVNKNPNDPRAARSVRDIKNTMLSLVEREPFAQIRVEQILSEAPVQSNTFYKYFASKQDVLDAIGDDLIARMRKELETLQPRDLRGGVMVFYHAINTEEPAYRKLFSEEEYAEFQEKIRDDFFDSDYFMDFCNNEEYAEIVPAFIGNVAAGTYRRWRENDNGKKRSLEQLADSTAELLLNGLKATEGIRDDIWP